MAWAWTPAFTTDLHDYLEREEPQFAWEVERESDAAGVHITVLKMTSQVWRDIPWEHRVKIFRPANVEYPGHAVLAVTGGSGKGDGDLIYGATVANTANMVFAILSGIPNQPLFDNLREDALIAHSFTQYIATQEKDWPLLFPMVKSAVKAMDAVEQFSEQNYEQKISQFLVTGASKRGWTSYLTGATDDRVVGIIPMVFDCLNVQEQLPHQIVMWERYSEQIADYTDRGLHAFITTPIGRHLINQVDPYTYLDDLDLPKLLIHGTNDRYWTVDAANLYWEDLPGDKWMHYVPNAGHGLGGYRPETLNAAMAFARATAEGKPLPSIGWLHEDRMENALLWIKSGEKPVRVHLWTTRMATSDFRDAKWEKQELEGNGVYIGEVPRPEKGWLALFGEVTYQDGPREYPLSTTIRVISAEGEPTGNGAQD